MCLDERIGVGWDGSGKEAWYFLGMIGGGYWFPETNVIWYYIEYCVSFLESP